MYGGLRRFYVLEDYLEKYSCDRSLGCDKTACCESSGIAECPSESILLHTPMQT